MTSVAESIVVKLNSSRRAALALVIHYFALKLFAEVLNPPSHALQCHPKAVGNSLLNSVVTERNIRWSVRLLSDRFIHSNDLHHQGRCWHQVRRKHRFVSTRLQSITSHKTIVFREVVSFVSPLISQCARREYRMRAAKKRESVCSLRTEHWCVLRFVRTRRDRTDSHYASRLRSVTVPSSFRQTGLCSHCPSCSVTFHNSTW
jgi:hypothetical protein